MSRDEWASLARWWRQRAEDHEAAGRIDRAKIAAARAATCERFAAPPASISNPSVQGAIDVDRITEYGSTQRLSHPVRTF